MGEDKKKYAWEKISKARWKYYFIHFYYFFSFSEGFSDNKKKSSNVISFLLHICFCIETKINDVILTWYLYGIFSVMIVVCKKKDIRWVNYGAFKGVIRNIKCLNV